MGIINLVLLVLLASWHSVVSTFPRALPHPENRLYAAFTHIGRGVGVFRSGGRCLRSTHPHFEGANVNLKGPTMGQIGASLGQIGASVNLFAPSLRQKGPRADLISARLDQKGVTMGLWRALSHLKGQLSPPSCAFNVSSHYQDLFQRCF